MRLRPGLVDALPGAPGPSFAGPLDCGDQSPLNAEDSRGPRDFDEAYRTPLQDWHMPHLMIGARGRRLAATEVRVNNSFDLRREAQGIHLSRKRQGACHVEKRKEPQRD